MFLRLLAAFCIVPLIELAILLWLASRTSWQLTLAIVVVTGILGAWLARQQGWRAWSRAAEKLERGEMPLEAVSDAVMILVAGALLLTPGILTDAVGFALLIPFSRTWIRRRLASRLQTRIHHSARASVWQPGGPRQQPQSTRIIDVQIVEPNKEGATNVNEDKS